MAAVRNATLNFSEQMRTEELSQRTALTWDMWDE